MSRAERAWDRMDGEEVPEALWQHRVNQVLHSRVGRERMKEFEAALLALPEKRLNEDKLGDGKSACLVGAIVAHRISQRTGCTIEVALARVGTMSEYDDDDDLFTTAGRGLEVGLPWTLAWTLAEKNDETWGGLTEEERYDRALAWVRANQLEGGANG